MLHGKTYYPLPIYPILIGAGGVALERLLFGAQWRRWLAWAYCAIIVIAGVVSLPFGVPLLPVDSFVRYSQILPYSRTVKMERDATVELPQLYADMFGWDNMAATVGRVYHALPEAEQRSCAILAGNYGEAGAIDYYGPALGLPKAISGHNNYYLWGPRKLFRRLRDSFWRERGSLCESFWRGAARRDYHRPVRNAFRARRPCIYLPQAQRAAGDSVAKFQNDDLTCSLATINVWGRVWGFARILRGS